jgi:hypothetical protein
LRPYLTEHVRPVACAIVGLFLLTGASLGLAFGDGVTLFTASRGRCGE